MEPYTQGLKVVVPDGRFEHVMAITLDPRSSYAEGVIRCIVSREGDVQVKGYIDRSQLYKIKAKGNGTFEITDRLVLKNEKEVVEKLKNGGDFIGLEDPDIFIDESGLMHLYFTMPIIYPDGKSKNAIINLGHAVGGGLDSLEMTEPVLLGDRKLGAKEVSIAPLNSKGFRYNLVESKDRKNDIHYSTIQVAEAHNMGSGWKFGPVVFHPVEHDIAWAGEHASPGPLLPKSFLDVGEGKLVGIMNGREKSDRTGEKTIYKTFSVGLMIYNYENGEIEWVSPEALIKDSEAKTITFASQFVETTPGEGTLYAHVDDSFVRAYKLNANGIKKLLPQEFL